ncbi:MULTISPECIES: hypothetical protein [unclassified Streptomyces]|uniref:hypothetical protein n=1 Tax=unclassified Streptomyces TaxID=2593676 RepID=UPI002E23CFCC|nr:MULTISPECIES: hypothetical protein [unclassified Streptomyces]
MANRKLIGGITAGLLVLGGAGTACDDIDTPAVGTPGTSTSTSTTAGSGEGKAPTGTGTETGTGTVPDSTGMGLQAAQDTAQEAGFYSLTSHDALGRGRMQAFDRNWKVCSQNVTAGKTVSTDTELDFGAVKLEEDCPAEDQSAPSAASGTMPDLKGKSVKAARSALDSGTSITVTDASGDGRFVLVESNWQVCTQTPEAGAKSDGPSVEFTAVKFDESCP